MEIKHCKRCDRDWCFRGTGRPLRCGKCKTPYWDVEAVKCAPVANVAERPVCSRPVAASIPRSKPSMDDLRSICAGNIPKVEIEPEPVEDVTPECCECGHKMTGKSIKGRGIVWACTDPGCPMYGREEKGKR
jgi:hypothetical protein